MLISLFAEGISSLFTWARKPEERQTVTEAVEALRDREILQELANCPSEAFASEMSLMALMAQR